MAPSNTAFILIPGSFSLPTAYDGVRQLLTSTPHSIPTSNITAITLPSTQGPASLHDDATHIASTISTYVDKGLNIVIAANSYGGMPMSESLNPALYDGAAVTKASRSAKGLKGGVVALVYIAAFLNPKGQSIVGLTGGLPGDDAMMDLSSMRSPEMAASVFGDLPQSEAEHHMNAQTLHSRASFLDHSSYEGWRDVRKVVYLHTKKDMIVKPELQMEMIEKVRGEGGKVQVVEMEASHVPMLGREREVLEVLVKAAEEEEA